MSISSLSKPKQGILMILLAMAIIGLVDNYVRVIAEEVGVWQFHFMRTVIMCSLIVLAAARFGWRLRPHSWRAVIVRSFFNSTGLILYFGALGLLPISQVAAGMFASPIFVLLISVVFLKTRVGVWRILAVVLGFIGVLLIIKPNAGELELLTVVPLLAGILYAIGNIATRQWCSEETTGALMMGAFLALGLWGLLGMAVFAVFPAAETGTFFTTGWVAPSGRFWFWLMVQALGSLAAVVFLTRGYQTAEVTFAAAAEYSFLIFAGFWAFLIWAQVPDTQSFLGIIAIIISGVVIALRSR